MLAKDIMTREVTTVKPDLSMHELAKTFARHHISGAPLLTKTAKSAGLFPMAIF